jgi:hypothetical protein
VCARTHRPLHAVQDGVRTPARASFYPASCPPSLIHSLRSICDLGAILPTRARRRLRERRPPSGPDHGPSQLGVAVVLQCIPGAGAACVRRPVLCIHGAASVWRPRASRTPPQGWPHALAQPASGVPAHPPHPPPEGGRTRWRSQRQASRASPALPQGGPHALRTTRSTSSRRLSRTSPLASSRSVSILRSLCSASAYTLRHPLLARPNCHPDSLPS